MAKATIKLSQQNSSSEVAHGADRALFECIQRLDVAADLHNANGKLYQAAKAKFGQGFSPYPCVIPDQVTPELRAGRVAAYYSGEHIDEAVQARTQKLTQAIESEKNDHYRRARLQSELMLMPAIRQALHDGLTASTRAHQKQCREVGFDPVAWDKTLGGPSIEVAALIKMKPKTVAGAVALVAAVERYTPDEDYEASRFCLEQMEAAPMLANALKVFGRLSQIV